MKAAKRLVCIKSLILIMNMHDSLSPELSKDELEELEAAEKLPITYDEDSPELTDDQLHQFRPMNGAFHKRVMA